MAGIEKEISGKTNIIFLTDFFIGMGGSERNIVSLFRGMDRNRFKIIVACFFFGAPSRTMQKEGYEVKFLRQTKIHSLDGLYNLFYLRRLIKRQNICLIVTYHESSDIYGLALLKISNVPIISNRRDMGFRMGWRHKIFY